MKLAIHKIHVRDQIPVSPIKNSLNWFYLTHINLGQLSNLYNRPTEHEIL